ncbi:MAG: hypothetical protein ACPGWR_20110, partial [Ardenticatenaceae bacterium]
LHPRLTDGATDFRPAGPKIRAYIPAQPRLTDGATDFRPAGPKSGMMRDASVANHASVPQKRE